MVQFNDRRFSMGQTGFRSRKIKLFVKYSKEPKTSIKLVNILQKSTEQQNLCEFVYKQNDKSRHTYRKKYMCSMHHQ